MAATATKGVQTATKKVIKNATVEAQLKRYMFLKSKLKEAEALEKEYKALKLSLKKYFKDKPFCQVGDYLIKGKYVTQPAKTVDAVTYWDMRVYGKPAKK